MSEKKYRILIDQGFDGLEFEHGYFPSIDAALKHGVAKNYCAKFCVVEMVWEPEMLEQTDE